MTAPGMCRGCGCNRLSVANTDGICDSCRDEPWLLANRRIVPNRPAVKRQAVKQPAGVGRGGKKLARDAQGRKLCPCGALVEVHSRCRKCHNAENRYRRALYNAGQRVTEMELS
jgi:hypothetical protein